MGIIKASFPQHRKRRRNPTRYSVQNKARQILQFKTQKEAAKALGVSDRTIRRWLSGETKQPNDPNFKQLTRQSQKARQKAYRQGAPRRVSVPPPVTTFQGRPAADTRKLTRDNQSEVIRAMAREGRNMRLIVRIPKSPDYPQGIASTPMTATSRMTPRGVNRFINRALQMGEIISIVTD